MKTTATFILSLIASITLHAQPNMESVLTELSEKYAKQSFDLLKECFSIPNDAHFDEHVQQNVAWAKAAFEKRSFKTTILKTDGPPLLLAERKVPKASKTVLIYLQIDGQPVDPDSWHQEDPWKPVLKARKGGEWEKIPWDRLNGDLDPEWRFFARSASDAKGPVVMFLTALDAFRQEEFKQSYNIKVIMDFEEELGSPHLPDAVETYKDELAADMLLIFDGPRHESNRPTLTFGARGIATITLTVFGPRVPQHSGHFGNYAPNPAMRLAQLLASMKDERGRVRIPRFYEGVELDAATREILAQTPDDEPKIKARIGIAAPDQVGSSYQEAIQYPSLNVRGMSSAWVGEQVRTIVPATATAEIDVRLVPEIDPERLIGLIRNHILEKGYYLISDRGPSDKERMQHDRIASFDYKISYEAFRTPYDSEVGIWLNQALTLAFGEEPIRKRMSGGSIPISPFVKMLGLPAVTVPTVNRDNNQHSPNENLRLGNYIEGVRTFLAILTQQI